MSQLDLGPEFEARAALARAAFPVDWGQDTFTGGALDMIRIAGFAGFDAPAIARRALMEPGHHGRKINARTIRRLMSEAFHRSVAV